MADVNAENSQRRNNMAEEEEARENIQDDREYLINLAEDYMVLTICGIITVVVGLVFCRQLETARFIYQCSKVLSVWCVGLLLKDLIMFGIDFVDYMLNGNRTSASQARASPQVSQQGDQLAHDLNDNFTNSGQMNPDYGSAAVDELQFQSNASSNIGNEHPRSVFRAPENPHQFSTQRARFNAKANDLPPSAFLSSTTASGYSRQETPMDFNESGIESSQSQDLAANIAQLRIRQRRSGSRPKPKLYSN